jgi:WD40 repeat protein
LYSRLPLVGGWLRLWAVRKLADDDSPEAVRLLAEAVASGGDREVRIAALEVLQEVERPRCVEAVCEVWARTRDRYLEELLTIRKWVPQAPPAVRVLYQLVKGREAEAASDGAEVVEPLLQLCSDNDVDIARRARTTLERLEAAEAHETLCRRVLDQDDALARTIALGARYAPREPGQRALFYFLTEQWAAYDSLDFDHSLLRAVYQAADARLRQRIAERARQAGRVEWVEVVTGVRHTLRLAEMTNSEWQATLDVLVGRQQWAELWRLAQEAPPLWAARLLQRLEVRDGLGTERAELEALLGLAQEWRDPDLAALLQPCRLAEGDAGGAHFLVITPDSRMLCAGGADGSIRVWSLPDGRLVRSLEGHQAPVRHLALGPKGRVLISADDEGAVRFWDLRDGSALSPLPRPLHSAPVTYLEVTHPEIGPIRNMVLSADRHGAVWGWDLMTHLPRRILRTRREDCCFAASPDGQLLASGDPTGTLAIWTFFGPQLPHDRQAHGAAVRCLALSPAGDLLASSSDLGEVCLWRFPEGTLIQRLKGHVGPVDCLAFACSGRLLASSGRDTTVCLWALPEGVALHTLAGHTEPIQGLAVSPDGRVLASCSADHTVELWSLPGGESRGSLSRGKEVIHQVAISPDGLVLAAAASGGVALWNAELARLSRIPVGKLTPQDLARAEETLASGGLKADERGALEFLVALARLRWRFDILLDSAPRCVEVGEFDILISG